MKRTLTALCLLILVGCKPKGEPEAADHVLRRVSLPTFALAEGERVSGVQIDLACGRFRAVNCIPDDWSLEIEGPVSEHSTLKAVANHGVSWLSNSSPLQDFATIMICSTSCFDITATVYTETGENEGKTRTFRRDQLRLEKLPDVAMRADSFP